MGPSATCFVPSGPLIVSEIIDDEAIVIDLEDGVYYSIQRVGAEVWAAVLDGVPMATLVEHLCFPHSQATWTSQIDSLGLRTFRIETYELVPSSDADPGDCSF